MKLKTEGCEETHELLKRIGAHALYQKALSLKQDQPAFISLLRQAYIQPILSGMLKTNQALRRFHSQRRLDAQQQGAQALSLSSDVADKLEAALRQHLKRASEDGYKVLLPAYLQRCVHNAVVDYIRDEWNWERSTLQDVSFSDEQEDPRQNVADDASRSPETLVLSKEMVNHLNALRMHLQELLKDPAQPQEALTVIDCLFGLGLTPHSIGGTEMTMRECCDRLNIPGETQARRIARCQVHLDKGLDVIRQRIRLQMPGLVEAWQVELNVNSASRRELSRQLGLTETEVEKLVSGRQFLQLDDLVKQGVIKPARLPEIAERGAVAAFVPVDLNSATARDLSDILGLPKDLSQKLVSERPYKDMAELKGKGLLTSELLSLACRRGAVLRVKSAEMQRKDLNTADISDLCAAGIPQPVADKIVRGRPFLTWAELEDYLDCDWQVSASLRQKYCLALTTS